MIRSLEKRAEVEEGEKRTGELAAAESRDIVLLGEGDNALGEARAADPVKLVVDGGEFNGGEFTKLNAGPFNGVSCSVALRAPLLGDGDGCCCCVVVCILSAPPPFARTTSRGERASAI